MPTNLYGPRDNFDLESAHVLPALIHRIHNAKNNGDDAVEIWGDGTPLREFLHVEDLARACLSLLHSYNEIEAIKAKVMSLFGNVFNDALGGRRQGNVPAAAIMGNSPEARRQRMIARMQRKLQEKNSK